MHSRCCAGDIYITKRMIGRGGMWWGKRRDVCVCVWRGERQTDRQTDRETDRQTDRRAGAKKKRYQMME